MRLRTFFAALSLAVAALSAPHAVAQDGGAVFATAPGGSAWQKEIGGRLRLVTAPAGPDGRARAAIEIELAPGFKTYWKNPGADGIPPQLSFFGSRNVAEASVTLPPPHVFRGKTVSVGYEEAVTFPIEVKVADPSRTYALAASGVVGFCANVCVPVPFRFEAGPPEGRVPPVAGTVASAAQPLVEPSETMRLSRALYDAAAGTLRVEATVPDRDVHLDLVVANPGSKVLPPAAQAVRQHGTQAVFTFDLARGPELEDGEELEFTMIVARFEQAGRIGVEQSLAVELAE